MRQKDLKYYVAVQLLLIGVLIGTLFKMPYGYYQFSKFVLFTGGIYSTWLYYKIQKPIQAVIYVVMAILFNPFMKFAFKRDEWQTIDKITITVLLGCTIYFLIKIKPYGTKNN